MKRISLVVIVALTLALLTYAYSQTPQSGSLKKVQVTAQTLASQQAGKPYVIDLTRSALMFAYSPAPQSGAQAGQTATQAQPSQPMKAKKILVNELPKGLEGIVLENGVFKLRSGYKFVNQTGNTVAVALKANNDINGTFSCGCYREGESGPTPSGKCKPKFTQEGALACVKDEGDPCSMLCFLDAKVDRRISRLAIY